MATRETRDFVLKDGKKVQIRSAVRQDAQQLIELSRAVMTERVYSLTDVEEFNTTLGEEEMWIEAHIIHPRKLILVVVVDGVVVGLLDFSTGHRKRIQHTGSFGMSVASQVRGRGLGALLLGELIAWAEEMRDIENIELTVHATNLRAIALYKKMGFVEEGRRRANLKYENSYVDSVFMTKFIRATQRPQELISTFWRLMDAQRWDDVQKLLHSEFVCDWPQSRERMLSAQNFVNVNRYYPGNHKIKIVHLSVTGDRVVTTVWIEADTGQKTFATSYFEVEDGRIYRLEEYWAEPYAAPESRKNWVETY